MARITAPLAAPLLAALLASLTLVAPPATPPARAQAAKKAPAAKAAPAAKQAAEDAPVGVNGPEIAANAWLLIDLSTGTTLAARKADERVEPASLTKLMTAYLVFNALKEKRLDLEQRPPVSTAAYKAGGSRMFIDPRQPATIGELLNGLIVQSGNDAAIVLAEALGGTEAQFAQQMNAQAKRLGMKATSFTNASGLPDAEHYSTANDLAILASHLINEHPSFYKLYSQREYTYNNIKQPNRNRLLFTDPSVDGLKTGHTDAAGYCLISSARRVDPASGFTRRLLSVVLGASSETSRAIESQKLLNYGFQHFQVVRLYKKNDPIGSYKVYKGVNPEVKAGFTEDIVATVARTQVDAVKGEIERVEPLVAPIPAGQPLGTLRIRLADKVIAERPVVALEKVDAAGWFGRAWDTIKLWIK